MIFSKTIKILLLGILSVMTSCSATKAVQKSVTHENLIIYYDPAAGNDDLLRAAKKYGSEVLYVYKNINGIAVSIPKNRSFQEAVNYYEKISGVISVMKDEKMQLD